MAMKNKMSGGKTLVTIDNIQIRERASRDANGLFVGLSFDSLAEVESIATEGEDFDSIEADLTPAPASVEENAVEEELPEDMPGQVEGDSEEANEEPQESSVPEPEPED